MIHEMIPEMLYNLIDFISENVGLYFCALDKTHDMKPQFQLHSTYPRQIYTFNNLC